MSGTALALVLVAAVLHATWNLAIKGVTEDRVTFIWLYIVTTVVCWVPVAVVWVVATGEHPQWEWLLGAAVTGILHVGYQLVLQRGYAEGDLNLVYPVARGSGPLLTFVVAVVVLGQRPGTVAAVGVLAVVAGVLLIALPDGQNSVRSGVLWGCLTGATIASYTLWDSYSVNHLDVPPLPYFVLGTVLQLPWLTGLMARAEADAGPGGLARDAGAGARGRAAVAAGVHPGPARAPARARVSGGPGSRDEHRHRRPLRLAGAEGASAGAAAGGRGRGAGRHRADRGRLTASVRPSDRLAGVEGLLLAAGAGRRMGMPKALVTDDRGSWLVRGVELLRDGGCARITVVLGAEAARARSLLVDLEVDVAVADDWAEGMGASLRTGLRSLDGSGDDGVVLTLVDLPDLVPEVVGRVIAAGDGPAALARAAYDGKPGHPVLLGRDHWAGVVETAVGDQGARAYLADRDVTLVECADLATGRDVDSRG